MTRPPMPFTASPRLLKTPKSWTFTSALGSYPSLLQPERSPRGRPSNSSQSSARQLGGVGVSVGTGVDVGLPQTIGFTFSSSKCTGQNCPPKAMSPELKRLSVTLAEGVDEPLK